MWKGRLINSPGRPTGESPRTSPGVSPNTDCAMKKKLARTRSSTPTSSANGKELKKRRLKTLEAGIFMLHQKVSRLMTSLTHGDLPEGVVIASLIKSQRANAQEMDEIKLSMAKMMREVNKLAGMLDQLESLDSSMANCIDKIQDLKLLLKPNKGSHGNKGKRKRKPAAHPY